MGVASSSALSWPGRWGRCHGEMVAWGGQVHCTAKAYHGAACNAIGSSRMKEGVHEFTLEWVQESHRVAHERARRRAAEAAHIDRRAGMLEERIRVHKQARILV